MSNQKEVSGLGKDDCLALLCLEIFALGIQYLKSVISLLPMMILFNNFKEKKSNPSLYRKFFSRSSEFSSLTIQHLFSSIARKSYAYVSIGNKFFLTLLYLEFSLCFTPHLLFCDCHPNILQFTFLLSIWLLSPWLNMNIPEALENS